MAIHLLYFSEIMADCRFGGGDAWEKLAALFLWVLFGLGMPFQEILPFSAGQFIQVLPLTLKVGWLGELLQAYFCSFITTTTIYPGHHLGRKHGSARGAPGITIIF